MTYNSWYKWLPPHIQLSPVNLPGREQRRNETPFRSVQSCVEALGEVLKSSWDKPFALFGHSMGALLSFELARQLRRISAPAPAHLFLSGRRAPNIRNGGQLHKLDDKRFIDLLRQMDGTPEVLLKDPEIMAVFLPIIRADFELLETYKYTVESPLEIPITVFGGRQDWEAPEEELLAWRDQTSRYFKFRMFEGSHFFIQSEAKGCLQILADDLMPYL